ncbi:MAG: hypothetical protein Q7T68_01875 [Sphingopyxis sp.]|nr:hypothetical protein [Sphingopyxis sp.]
MMVSALAGCGTPEPPRASSGDEAPKASAKSVKQTEEDRTVFEEMAPPGWALQRFEGGLASYVVSIKRRPGAPEIGLISGHITLDGRNEPMVKLRSGLSRDKDQSEHDREEVLNLYPDYQGYKKNVAVGSIGYDVKRGEDIRALKYYNLEKKISCYGHTPGQFRCYWGTPEKRMGIIFYSEDLGVVLPYVLKRADVG